MRGSDKFPTDPAKAAVYDAAVQLLKAAKKGELESVTIAGVDADGYAWTRVTGSVCYGQHLLALEHAHDLIADAAEAHDQDAVADEASAFGHIKAGQC